MHFCKQTPLQGREAPFSICVATVERISVLGAITGRSRTFNLGPRRRWITRPFFVSGGGVLRISIEFSAMMYFVTHVSWEKTVLLYRG